MGDVTHEQVNLMLRLYDMRREPVMREAREWYFSRFRPASLEDVYKQAPLGSQRNAFVRMVISYWDMVASIVNRGLIDEDFFFENTGEQWIVYERIRAFVPAMRERSKNPNQYRNLQKHVEKLEAWRERHAPGATEAMRQMIAGLPRPTAKAKDKKK